MIASINCIWHRHIWCLCIAIKCKYQHIHTFTCICLLDDVSVWAE